MSNANLYARFERVFEAHAQRVPIRSADGAMSLTFGDLAAGVGRYANALAALGVEAGDKGGLIGGKFTDQHRRS